ncbi:hypothetical protein P7K49_033852 [Saguinus oedipus]|uniref:Uncharacterized protein n=1 Tax=Saguinus oedipus TaxID=9490 RepID=A0ABQ9TTY8_SAGOE|nr:hypothetical protein P7K49_033852 [Saguinus oedipus]
MEDDVVLQTLQVGFRPSGTVAGSGGPRGRRDTGMAEAGPAAHWSVSHSGDRKSCEADGTDMPVKGLGLGHCPLEAGSGFRQLCRFSPQHQPREARDTGKQDGPGPGIKYF